ncbi:MAG: hypothetical protein Q9187_008161 [Circinaria calcarea]
MHPPSFVHSVLAVLLVIAGTFAAPFYNSTFSQEGFDNASVTSSTGGEAVCITGNVRVTASTNANVNLRIPEPTNQTEVTEGVVQYLQVNNAGLAVLVNGGPSTVSGTYTINAKLCFPNSWSPGNSSKTIQFLIHGFGFDKSYWDFAKGYSFVDIAAAAGYPTFSYDRLGVGLSDHPDPIQVVQAPLEIEIAHTLIQSLRVGKFAGQRFERVVGVGHAFGSIQVVGVTDLYLEDFDAIVLTGFTLRYNDISLAVAGLGSAIASQNQPSRFAGLPNGYLVTDTLISNQFVNARFPHFDPTLLAKADTNKQTFTLGEIFTFANGIDPSPSFTGPVDVVDGANDFLFCQGDCTYPLDQAAVIQQILYPAATNGSESFLVPGVGSAISLHYDAGKAYQQVQTFVGRNGL